MSQELIEDVLRNRRLNSAKNMAVDGWIHDRERRESVLRKPSDIFVMDKQKKKITIRNPLEFNKVIVSVVTAGCIIAIMMFAIGEMSSVVNAAQTTHYLGNRV